ncbi:MAG TPA: autoinducer binding domain-containing protein [Roseiarcus sp.]|jgi:hypothetical protein|nr:autoinducer binding domain-containing protein [Roseiarcus sp.]
MLELAAREAFKIGGSAVRLTDTILGFVEQDLSETLREIALEIGVSHIACLRFAPDKSSDTSLLSAIVTYSKEWQLRYFVKQYIKIDPTIAYGRIAVQPFDWEILRDGDPAVLGFLADAANHGVGRNGLSIPVRSRRGGLFPRFFHQRSSSGGMGAIQKRECRQAATHVLSYRVSRERGFQAPRGAD